MQKKALVIATSLAMSSPLHADDLSFYGGGALLRTELDAHFDFESSNPFTGNSADDNASTFKLFGGIRKKAGKLFYGAELAFDDGDAKPVGAFSKSGNPKNGQRGEIEEKSSVSISAIGGIGIGTATYLTGRIGYIRTDFDFRTLEGDNVISSGDETFSDIEFAVGLEHHFTNKIGARVEISKTSYSDDINTVGTGTGDLVEFDDISRDAVSIGVFAKF